jgi:hypothetical protein
MNNIDLIEHRREELKNAIAFYKSNNGKNYEVKIENRVLGKIFSAENHNTLTTDNYFQPRKNILLTQNELKQIYDFMEKFLK